MGRLQTMCQSGGARGDFGVGVGMEGVGLVFSSRGDGFKAFWRFAVGHSGGRFMRSYGTADSKFEG